jgi:hypothetical protein
MLDTSHDPEPETEADGTGALIGKTPRDGSALISRRGRPAAFGY